MRIRLCFVSNSSSSSFIIKVPKKKNEPCPTCGHCAPDIMDYMDNRTGDFGYDKEVRCQGKREVLSQVKEYKGWMEEKEYKEMLKALTLESENVAIVCCSNCDEVTKDFLRPYVIHQFSD